MRGHQAGRQPYCRHCGGAIPKLTGVIFFGQSDDQPGQSPFSRSSSARPKDRAEAQRQCNQQIVSTRWSVDRTWIQTAGFWDGISYRAEFFCADRCAVAFAHVCAASGMAMQAYKDAIREAQEAAA